MNFVLCSEKINMGLIYIHSSCNVRYIHIYILLFTFEVSNINNTLFILNIVDSYRPKVAGQPRCKTYKRTKERLQKDNRVCVLSEGRNKQAYVSRKTTSEVYCT
jgi:hypothetical protein